MAVPGNAVIQQDAREFKTTICALTEIIKKEAAKTTTTMGSKVPVSKSKAQYSRKLAQIWPTYVRSTYYFSPQGEPNKLRKKLDKKDEKPEAKETKTSKSEKASSISEKEWGKWISISTTAARQIAGIVEEAVQIPRIPLKRHQLYKERILVSNTDFYDPEQDLEVEARNGYGVAQLGDQIAVAWREVAFIDLYNFEGVRQAMIFVPFESGWPTGIVALRLSTNFSVGGVRARLVAVCPNSDQGYFLENGSTINAWSAALIDSSEAPRVALVDAPAIFTGVAVPQPRAAERLYISNIGQASVDVYNTAYELVERFRPALVDSNLRPYNVYSDGFSLFIALARFIRITEEGKEKLLPVEGSGAVAVVRDLSTAKTRRRTTTVLVQGPLLSIPYGMAVVPYSAVFRKKKKNVCKQEEEDEKFKRKDKTPRRVLLVGNEGNGRIHAFDAECGTFLGRILVANGKCTPLTFAIEKLRGLVHTTTRRNSDVLFFAAGPETPQEFPDRIVPNGVFGRLDRVRRSNVCAEHIQLLPARGAKPRKPPCD